MRHIGRLLVRALGCLALTALAACAKEGAPSIVVPEAVTAGQAPAPPPSSKAAPPKDVLRPTELLAHADAWLGKTVELDIVEPLEGPVDDAAIPKSEYGQYTVDMPEGGDAQLDLVPPAFNVKGGDNRYKVKFDHVLEPPIHVRGELLRDDAMSTPTVYVVRVQSSEPLDLGRPELVSDPSTLGDDGRYDRKLVEIVGTPSHGFERSTILDAKGASTSIWVSGAHYRAGALGAPSSPCGNVGVLFARPAGRYGHLGASRYELMQAR